MSKPTLQEQIRAVSETLRHTAAADDATCDSLESLQHEIETFLQARGGGSLTERLEKLAVRFENDHPAVGSALRQAIDALSKAGI